MAEAEVSPTRRVFLFTHARTASHLLERMLSRQPNVSYASHFFAKARPLQVKIAEEGPLDRTSKDVQRDLFRTYQEGFSNFEDFIREAEQASAIPFFHGHPHFMLSPVLISQYIYGDMNSGSEHSWTVLERGETEAGLRTNPTIVPDIFLLRPGTVPIFTIREPVLMVPSIYRAIVAGENKTPSKEILLLSCTLRWSRMLYEWFLHHGAPRTKPLIIDAQDFMRGKAIVEELCREADLSADAVIDQWPKATEEELHSMPPFVAELKKDILGSEGLIPRSATRDVVLEQEEGNWKSEFGEEVATLLNDLVRRTMPDYDFLRSKAITLP